jgi:hypothetical protein
MLTKPTYNMRRLILLFLIVAFPFSDKLYSQGNLRDTHKVVFYNYNEFNSRITQIFSSDTLEIKMSNIADSIYYYQSTGYFNIKLQVDTKLKKAKYENSSYDELGYDEPSIKAIREAFEVKYVSNKIFEHRDKKYFVYRILVTNKKIKDFGILIFWSKEFGIIMEKYLNENILLRFDYANDEEKNKIVQHLCYFVFSDYGFNSINDWKKYLE